MSKLVNIFAACAVSVPLAGCQTTQSHMDGRCMGGVSVLYGLVYTKSFNDRCADSKVANTMLASGRQDLQLVGAAALRNQSPAIDKAFNDVKHGKGGPAPVKTAKTCTVTQVAGEKSKDSSTVALNCNN